MKKIIPFIIMAIIISMMACTSKKQAATANRRVQTYYKDAFHPEIYQPKIEKYVKIVGPDGKLHEQRVADDDTSALFYEYMGRIRSYNKDWRRPTTLPDLDFVDAKGNHVTRESLKGKIVVFNFFNTYCGPCIKEIPKLNSWLDEYPDVEFFAINFQDEEIVRKCVEKYGFRWSQVTADSTMTVWLPNQSHYPSHVVADQNGFVRYMECGGDSLRHRRVIDSLNYVIAHGPRTSPLNYKDLHYEEEYYSE